MAKDNLKPRVASIHRRHKNFVKIGESGGARFIGRVRAIDQPDPACVGRPEAALENWPGSAGTIFDNVLKTRAILFAADNIHVGLMISPKIIADIELR